MVMRSRMNSFFKNYRIPAIICIGLFTNVYAYGQKVWSLGECVNYALDHNLTVKQNVLSVELNKLDITHNQATMLPSLSASGSNTYNFGRSVDPFSYTFTNQEIRSANVSLNGNLTIFNGFQLQNTLRLSKLDYQAGQHDLQKIKNDISLNVISNYLQVLYAKEQLSIAANRVTESEKQKNKTKLLVDAGTMTKGNLLDAESQLATEELNQVTAESQFSNARLTLIQLLELDSAKDFSVEEPKAILPDSSIMKKSPEEIYHDAILNLPEIKSADIKVLSAQKRLEIAKGARYPHLSLFGSLSSGYSSTTSRFKSAHYNGYLPNGDVTSSGDTVFAPSTTTVFEKTPWRNQLDQNYSKSFGLSLSIPIFNGWSTETSIRRARINVLNTELSDEIARRQVYKSIQQAMNDAAAAQKKYIATQKSLDALSEAYQYAQKRFDAGLTSSLEFLTATNNLTRVKVELLQAKYDYIFKIKILDFYAGKSILF